MSASLNTLGFAKAPADTRVVVAMSGGVDSSVVASLLHEQGYDVIGVTLQLYDHGAAIEKKGACCAGQDIYDAQRIAAERGFPHYVLNYEDKFKDSVIEEFADSYLRGETPVPCIQCNQTVKFKDLLAVARDLGADCMATGHYIQRSINPETGHAEMIRAVDPGKDQSYFLFATTQDQLDYLRFPLGGWTKDITRAHAQRLGLITADKPDSQDICFVPGGDYTKIVKGLRPQAGNAGNIVHIDGRVLGTHDGIIHYTIGQRKGLGIGGGHSDANDPFYVVKLDATRAEVIVGPKEALARDTIHLKNCNWLLDDRNLGISESRNSEILIKFRSTMAPIPARLIRHADGSAIIGLDAAQYGISPGQAAVCYVGDRMIGGGWIAMTGNSLLQNAA